ncbi:unnamed protein product [Leptidea sinapis]|uniref:Uncharacterized protein n=1 Tax=Leptidea sinapis TaxID=189913 RepID=A0A5E4QG56_9NEOP|nr:unnamed protein product [Leptidea sinapis]
MCGGLPQCGFQGAFFHVPQSSRTPSLNVGNAPVIPLVLLENVGGDDHLRVWLGCGDDALQSCGMNFLVQYFRDDTTY